MANIQRSGLTNELHRLTSGTRLIMGGECISLGLLYATSILLSRGIGADGYGIYFLASVVAYIADLIGRAGLEFTVMRFVAYYKGKQQPTFVHSTSVLVMLFTILGSLIMARVLYLATPWIANTIFHKPDLIMPIRWFAWMLPLSNLIPVFTSMFLAHGLVKNKILLENILYPFVKLVFIAVLLSYGMGLHGVMIAIAVATLIAVLVAGFRWFQHIDLPVVHQPEPVARKIVRFALPAGGEALLNYISTWVELLLLGYFTMADEVGILGVIIRVTMLVVFVQYAFNGIFSPIIAELHGRNNIPAVEQLLKKQTIWSFSCALPVVLLFAYFSTEIMTVWGSSFVLGSLALIIIAVGRLADAAVGAVGMLIMMMGKPKVNTINASVMLLIKVAVGWYLIPRWGLLGAAILMAGTNILLDLIRIVEVYILFRIHPYSREFGKPFVAALAGAVLAGAIYFVIGRQLPLLVAQITATLTFTLVYVWILHIWHIQISELLVPLRERRKFAVS